MSLQNSIDAVTGTALVYKDYITGTCLTGSQTLGAGHNLISGKQGADLITKSLVGGTNVTLSSDDSTITINASAGGGGGGSCSGILNYRGQYVEGTSYKANDFVTYNGKSYITTSDNDGSYNPEGAYLVTADVTASNTVPTIPISYDPYGNATYITNGHPYFNAPEADVNLYGPASSVAGEITGLIYPTGTGLYVGLRSNENGKFINFDNIKIHRGTGTSHVLYNWDGTTTAGWNARVDSSIVVDNGTLKVSSVAGVSSIYVGTVLDFASEINGNPWSLLAGEIAVNNCGGSSSAGGGGGGGSTEEGYLLQQFTGFVNNGGSYSPVLDANSEYKVAILNRTLASSYNPIWYSFDIDSSDGATSNLAHPGGSYIGTGYNIGTNTLTITASSTQIYEAKIYKKVAIGGGSSSAGGGGGGSCGENGIGPGSMSGIAERSNFAGRLPDVIYGTIEGAGQPNYWRVPLYLAEIEKPGETTDRIYYRPLSNAGTNWIAFDNNANGTYLTVDGVGGVVERMYDGDGNDFSLQQYISSGYAAFYNSGCGGGSAGGGGSSSADGGSSSSGGIGSNSFITGASNFYTNLPDSIVCDYSTTPSKVIFNLDWVGESHIFYSYVSVDGGNNLLHGYAKFQNDSSGTADGNYGPYQGAYEQLLLPRLSLSGFLDSGRAIYYGGGSSSSAGDGGGSSSAGGGASVAQSTYVGDGASTGIYIPLSFTPNKVEIHSAGSTDNGGPYYGKTTLLLSQSGQQSIRTYIGGGNTQIAYSQDNGSISGQGFLAKGDGNDSVFNHNGCTYHYVAIGSGGSSAGDALPVSGLQNNKFLKGSANANNFERDLPDAVFVSGAGGAGGSLIKVDFVGNAGNYYMYGRQVNQSTNCRMDFRTNDISGTKIGGANTVNCSTPYASLAEMIDSGAAIYY